ncbi:MAG: hypothetical protein HEQ39_00090 [Rhizobacter sp.]
MGLTLTKSGHVLPAALLPLALEQARRSVALRASLHAALGERGWWLARQRETWAFAAAVSEQEPQESGWTEGSLEQRLVFLRRERSQSPDAARERLAAVLTEVPAKERAELLLVLNNQLSANDENLIDQMRSDRSKEVRQVALKLLLNLPEAAHPQRATTRMRALLTQERVLLRKTWLIAAPASAAEDWAADNLEVTRPTHDSLGERAWWLFQLARQVPLAWWGEHTGMSPQELLAWAHQGDWAPSLCRAWHDVLLAAPNPLWCDAFLNHWPDSVRDDAATVLALLPLAQREQHWERQWRANQISLSSLVHQVLQACPPGETLSASLSQTLAHAVVQLATANKLSEDYSLRGLLPDLACALHESVLPVLAQLPRHDAETASFAENLHTLTQVIVVRQSLLNISN